MTLPAATVWRTLEAPGLEHLALQQDAHVIRADSVVIGMQERKAFGLSYRLALDRAWRLRETELRLAGADRALVLRGDGEGNWRDAAGRELPAFRGCIDIDISATPFTNTLPIRRLTLPVGDAREIDVIYVPVPGLEPRRVRQRYTRSAVDRYLYEGLESGFQAELPIDAKGLVTDYPGLFERLP